jgi:hypothetical protein
LAYSVDDPLAEAPVEVAHQLRIRLGQLPERAVQELDAGGPAVAAVVLQRGLEAELAELGLQRGEAVARPGAGAGFTPPDPAGGGGVVGIGADPFGHRGEEPGEQRVRRRVETEARRPRTEEVEVLGSPDGAPMDGLDVDQTRLAQAVEVQAHRVGVDAEAIREIRGRERGRGTGELLVHRVAGLVPERLEHRQLVL